LKNIALRSLLYGHFENITAINFSRLTSMLDARQASFFRAGKDSKTSVRLPGMMAGHILSAVQTDG
jgi:hypothetical protein